MRFIASILGGWQPSPFIDRHSPQWPGADHSGLQGPSFEHLEWEYQRRQRALENYRRCHGTEPGSYFNAYTLLRDYSRLPTLDEMSARLAALSDRIAAAKERRRATDAS